MESFFRYISYVDYFENGDRVRTVGFLRWKLQNGRHKLEIQIKDIPKVHGTFPIMDVETGIILDSIFLDKGIGNYRESFSAYIKNGQHCIQTEKTEIYLDELKGFQIHMDNDRILKVPIKLPLKGKNQIDNRGKKEEKSQTDIIEKSNVETKNIESMATYKTKSRDIMIKKDSSTEIEAASENVLIDGIEEKYEINMNNSEREPTQYVSDEFKERKENEVIYKDPIRKENEVIYTNPIRTENKDDYMNLDSAEKETDNEIMVVEPVLYANKWQQLCASYPIVHPFKSGREFLSIKPEDFIILQQGYQNLVHNSFLLHGFYNYQHMILGRLSDDKEAPYYVGVPGVYYDREKQAAQMFGFAGFESTEIPVQNGSYGYYMIEVEI